MTRLTRTLSPLWRPLGLWGLLVFAPACATAPAPASETSPQASPQANEDIGVARKKQRSHPPMVGWQEFSPQAFARAKAEGKLVLLDCVATWCHWCHVMDETTYDDDGVGALLRERFVTVRVDVDSRPDIGDRYSDWGWPATVIFDASGAELGKFRGYLAPEEMTRALETALSASAKKTLGDTAAASTSEPAEAAAPPEALSFVGSRVALDMDSRYDDIEAGWGRKQKLVLGKNLEFEIARARHGDSAALERARVTFEKQGALLDPIWGGVYQYSTGGDWTHPHFEKRLPIQTETIEALAQAYALTHERRYFDDALRIDAYLREFLQDADGAFLVSQDADLGGFEAHGRFVDGHVFYAQDNTQRRALGIPRIDRNVYAYENGLGIAALCALAAVAPDVGQKKELLFRARRTADLMLKKFVDADGTVWRARTPPGAPRLLSDAAALGRGLARLAVLTGEPSYKLAAQKVAAAMLRLFAVRDTELSPNEPSERRWLLWAHTPDAAAVGVFAQRERPFAHNVVAARFLAGLGDAAMKSRAQKILSGLATPQSLDSQGRFLGEYLLALDEVGAIKWSHPVRAAK